MYVESELVVVHVPDEKDTSKLIPVPAVVLEAGREFSFIRMHKDDLWIEISIQNDLLSRR